MRALYLLTIGDVQVLQSLLDRARKLKKIHGQNIPSRTTVLNQITTARMMHLLPILSAALNAQRYSPQERSTRKYTTLDLRLARTETNGFTELTSRHIQSHSSAKRLDAMRDLP
jgi:hypothetical protein